MSKWSGTGVTGWRLAALALALAWVCATAACAQGANPFAAEAAETAAGRYVSEDGKVCLHLKPKAGAFAGTLLLNGQEFDVTAELRDTGLVGQFSKGTDSWPFTAESNGLALTFKTGEESRRLVRKPFAFRPGEFKSEKVSLKLEQKDGAYNGLLTFKGQDYPVTARLVADELVGTAKASDGSEFGFTLVDGGEDGDARFACGPFRDSLCSGVSNGKPWTSPATGMEFVWVPALKLWVGKYEVTNGEYRKKEPSHDSEGYKGHTLNEDRQPVVCVNFDDAKAYAVWLTERDKGQLGGLRYRVISENEWQTCAQCGDGREYPWGNDMPPRGGNYADSAAKREFTDWTVIEGCTDGFAVTCDVERSGANEWGLYGIGGNVWEWCASDASGSSFGANRGAAWNDDYPDGLRCAFRISRDGSRRTTHIGFRLVLSR